MKKDDTFYIDIFLKNDPGWFTKEEIYLSDQIKPGFNPTFNILKTEVSTFGIFICYVLCCILQVKEAEIATLILFAISMIGLLAQLYMRKRMEIDQEFDPYHKLSHSAAEILITDLSDPDNIQGMVAHTDRKITFSIHKKYKRDLQVGKIVRVHFPKTEVSADMY